MNTIQLNEQEPKHKKINEMHFFGYKSIMDLIMTIWGAYGMKSIALKISIASLAAYLSYITEFIESWVWSPIWTLILYFIILIGDFITGILVGVKIRKEGFLTSKAQRIAIIFLFHFVLLICFHNLEKLPSALGVEMKETLFLHYIGKIMYLYIILVNLQSFIGNGVMLGVIKGSVATFFVKHIDPHKHESLQEIKNKKEEQVESETQNKEVLEQ